MATRSKIEGAVEIVDIANPGYGPIFAIQVQAAGREWVFSDNRVLCNDKEFVQRFADIVTKRGDIDTDYWIPTSMTEQERVDHWDAMYEWEEMEKLNGNW